MRNQADKSLDSVWVDINGHHLTTKPILPGDSISVQFSEAQIRPSHDVVFTFNAFIKDSSAIKAIFFSNDLGYLPDRFKVTFTNKGQLVQDSVTN